MGWTSCRKPASISPKQILIDHCLKWSCPAEAHPQVVAHGTGGGAHYFALRYPKAYFEHYCDGKAFGEYVPGADGSVTVAAIFLVTSSPRSEYNFSYKDIGETGGPYVAECPARVLDALSPLQPPEEGQTDGGRVWAAQWRARCRENLAAKAKALKLVDGLKLALPAPISFTDGCKRQRFELRLEPTWRGKTRKVFTCLDTGARVRISSRSLIGATAIA